MQVFSLQEEINPTLIVEIEKLHLGYVPNASFSAQSGLSVHIQFFLFGCFYVFFLMWSISDSSLNRPQS